MGFGGISPWSLVIILLIVVLLFGTKKLRNMGGDLGGALKNFKKAMSDDDKEQNKLDEDEDSSKKEQDTDNKDEKSS